MKNDLQALKASMIKKRGTGRTRRMIFEAARHVFLEGRSVVIVAKTASHEREIILQVGKYFKTEISNNIYNCIIGKEDEFVKTFTSKPVVLYDHYCFEQELLDLMEKYTIYDNDGFIPEDSKEREQGIYLNRMYDHHD